MGRSLVIAVLAGAIGSACIAALLVVFGGWDRLVAPPLTARVLLHEVKVPSAFSLDDRRISDELVRRMKRRAETDAALRIMLGEDGNKMLRDRAIPRLLNAGVIRRMIAEMDGLGAVIAFAGYGSWGEIRITNSGDEPMNDVAITVPNTERAELNGSLIEITSHERGLKSVSLGQLTPGQSVALAVWFTESATAISERAGDFRLGADGGARGLVTLYDPQRNWNGANLEIQSWARWLIAGVLAFVATTALAVLMMVLVNAIRRRFLRRV